MVFYAKTYAVLVVSSSQKMNTAFAPLLSPSLYEPVAYAQSTAGAKRLLLERAYDFVIVNAPLADDAGIRFAMDAASDRSTVVLLLVPEEKFEEIREFVTPGGVYTLAKPTSAAMLTRALGWMAATRERLAKLSEKTATVEEKMEEIRLVNRAKWLLIERLSMTEADAHRTIEKRAMDTGQTRRKIAEDIIKTYQP